MLCFGRLLLVSLLLSFSSAYASDEDAPPPPLDPEYMGSHDMIIVAKGTTLYAYPIPGYEKPDNQQIIYKVGTDTPSIRFLVRDADIVTARSKPFNLQRLIRGEEIEIAMDIYMGHFDRGGMKIHEEAIITFDKLLYHRSFEDIKPSSIRQIYDMVKVGKNEFILVHQLHKKPTYDNLLLFDDMVNCVKEFTTSTPVPTIMQIFSRLNLCGPMKPLYYETELYQ